MKVLRVFKESAPIFSELAGRISLSSASVLSADPPPVITAGWIGASFTPEEARIAEQREALAVSDTLVAELEATDEYVVGVPMHNFTIASTLRLWID